MPKQTFYNIQLDKQERIINASKKEFIRTNFYDASINQIIKDAGISRGSFYQYFEDKEDLFTYLLENSMLYLLSEVSKKAANKNLDIFEMHILTFDIITSGILNEDYKEFIIHTIAEINIRLLKDLSKNILVHKLQGDKKIEMMDNIVNYDNLKSTDKEYIQNLHHLLGMSMLSQLVSYFANINTLQEAKDNLINLMESIKHGVLK